ncbi:hypothetical protein CANCADRAFT_104016 [Tortispora caseinolytica NRRL Y-17796]|uniref:BIR-domain-containing protein n=1 Tax=Tortispora caseinolytica NRRL Y-17796 TaxID=767744 RepID=A0A1E4TET9_9ASCO|nr:hypothetical protein CANCADRAFT_104016 [Tortispora caseinolytica NRRL Y-17796]
MYNTVTAREASFRKGAKPLADDGSKSKVRKFSHWPHQQPSISKLANAGFYYSPTVSHPDNVKCFFCGFSLYSWEPTDDPLLQHNIYASQCAFAASQLGDTDDRELALTKRIETFGVNWPHDNKRGWLATSRKVAEAGFHYVSLVPEDDNAVCTSCGLALEGWEPKDDPIEEHRKRAPKCDMLPENITEPKLQPRRRSSRIKRKSESLLQLESEQEQLAETEKPKRRRTGSTRGRRSSTAATAKTTKTKAKNEPEIQGQKELELPTLVELPSPVKQSPVKKSPVKETPVRVYRKLNSITPTSPPTKFDSVPMTDPIELPSELSSEVPSSHRRLDRPSDQLKDASPVLPKSPIKETIEENNDTITGISSPSNHSDDAEQANDQDTPKDDLETSIRLEQEDTFTNASKSIEEARIATDQGSSSSQRARSKESLLEEIQQELRLSRTAKETKFTPSKPSPLGKGAMQMSDDEPDLKELIRTPNSRQKENVIWEEIDLDSVFGSSSDLGLKELHSIPEEYLDKTVEEWLEFNKQMALRNLRRECEEKIKILKYHGNRALNTLKSLR